MCLISAEVYINAGAHFLRVQKLVKFCKYNKGIKYLLCAIDLFSKYAWVVPLKDKRRSVFLMHLKRHLSQMEESQIKYGLIQVVNFKITPLKFFLKMNNTEMYSTYNEGRSVVAERFIRTLKNKIFKHMTAISKNVYFDVLDHIVNKYNNTVHRKIKMKPIKVTSNSYAYNEDFNKKDFKFKIGDHVRVSKYKNIFAKGYTPN